MALDHPLADGQPQAGPFEFGFAVQTIEGLKNPLRMLRGKPNAVVRNTYGNIAAGRLVRGIHSNADQWRDVRPMKFERVSQQILEELAQKRSIA